MNIESELRNALRRTEPPPGFADRVITRIAVAGRSSAGRSKPARARFRALAAAALIAITLGGWGVHVALRARDEVLIAMRIAGAKVAHAQREVRAVSH